MYFSLKYLNVMLLLEILVYTYFTICFTLFENMFLYHIFDSTSYFFPKGLFQTDCTVILCRNDIVLPMYNPLIILLHQFVSHLSLSDCLGVLICFNAFYKV